MPGGVQAGLKDFCWSIMLQSRFLPWMGSWDKGPYSSLLFVGSWVERVQRIFFRFSVVSFLWDVPPHSPEGHKSDILELNVGST